MNDSSGIEKELVLTNEEENKRWNDSRSFDLELLPQTNRRAVLTINPE